MVTLRQPLGHDKKHSDTSEPGGFAQGEDLDCLTIGSSSGIGFAASAGKHYFVIGTKAAFFWLTHASVPAGLPP